VSAPTDPADRRRRLLLTASGPALHHPAGRDDEAATFFHLRGVDVEGLPCSGTACFVARHLDPDRWRAADTATIPLRCAGACGQAPAVGGDATRPRVVAATATPVLLERLRHGPVPDLAAYVAAGGYQALETARAAGARPIVEAIEASRVRGRGGAAFPAGTKWKAVRSASRGDAVVVVNADEGDPGAYLDRWLLEDDPHAVLEGLAIAALGVGARSAYVYVRAEYPGAQRTIAAAIAAARSAGILPGLDVQVVAGHGSYVCGEETALLEAIEGRRPQVRPRPPFPAQRGLWGRPTLVHNVETLAAVPWIIRHGGDAYASMGAGTSRGTKVLSLSSLFARPGLYEVELGVPVRHIVEDLGGGLARGTLAGVLIGGPLTGVVPPWLLDTPLTIDDLRAIGADLGHGGVVAWDEHTSIIDLVRHVFAFGAAESCGICTPCRVGADEIVRLVGAPIPVDGAAARFADVVDALGAASLCGHGTGLAAFARSVVRHYGEELERCLA
jgi:NADH:ubiquinone oxidoreductase subunit F (NADH-binding)